MNFRPSRIIAGGQVGTDLGALRAARRLGIPTGGTAPKGWLTEAGPVPQLAGYGLVEATIAGYPYRTERNVFDSNATLLFRRDRIDGGTAETHGYCLEHGRPFLLMDWRELDRACVVAWLGEVRPEVLNVAGPRETKAPGIGRVVFGFLVGVWS